MHIRARNAIRDAFNNQEWAWAFTIAAAILIVLFILLVGVLSQAG